MIYELKTKKQTKRTCIEEHWKDSIQVFKMFDLNQNMNVWSLQNYPSVKGSFTLCGCETDNSKMTKTTLQCFPTFDLIIKVRKDCSNRKVTADVTADINVKYSLCYFSHERSHKMCTC